MVYVTGIIQVIPGITYTTYSLSICIHMHYEVTLD